MSSRVTLYVPIVGENFVRERQQSGCKQAVERDLGRECKHSLLREPNNVADCNALLVLYGDTAIGYVPGVLSTVLSPLIDAGLIDTDVSLHRSDDLAVQVIRIDASQRRVRASKISFDDFSDEELDVEHEVLEPRSDSYSRAGNESVSTATGPLALARNANETADWSHLVRLSQNEMSLSNLDLHEAFFGERQLRRRIRIAVAALTRHRALLRPQEIVVLETFAGKHFDATLSDEQDIGDEARTLLSRMATWSGEWHSMKAVRRLRLSHTFRAVRALRRAGLVSTLRDVCSHGIPAALLQDLTVSQLKAIASVLNVKTTGDRSTLMKAVHQRLFVSKSVFGGAVSQKSSVVSSVLTALECEYSGQPVSAVVAKGKGKGSKGKGKGKKLKAQGNTLMSFFSRAKGKKNTGDAIVIDDDDDGDNSKKQKEHKRPAGPRRSSSAFMDLPPEERGGSFLRLTSHVSDTLNLAHGLFYAWQSEDDTAALLESLGRLRPYPYTFDSSVTQSLFISREQLDRFREASERADLLFELTERKSYLEACALLDTALLRFAQLESHDSPVVILDSEDDDEAVLDLEVTDTVVESRFKPELSINDVDFDSHVFLRRFRERYHLLRAIRYGVDALEKQKMYERAVDVLKLLLENDKMSRSRRKRWHERMLIDLGHLKRQEDAVLAAHAAASDKTVPFHERRALARRRDALVERAEKRKQRGRKRRKKDVVSDDEEEPPPKRRRLATEEVCEWLEANSGTRHAIHVAGGPQEVQAVVLHARPLMHGETGVRGKSRFIGLDFDETEAEHASGDTERSLSVEELVQCFLRYPTQFLEASGQQSHDDASTVVSENTADGEEDDDTDAQHLSQAENWIPGAPWNSLHDEGSCLRMLFCLLLHECLFDTSVPFVFQTAFQNAPLDFHSDAFYASRSERIESRLAEIAAMSQGELQECVRKSWLALRDTAVVFANWSLQLRDLVSVAGVLRPNQLVPLLRRLCFPRTRSGLPDLIAWNDKQCVFVEVKGPNDRLSDTQTAWIHFMNKVAKVPALVASVRVPK
ncbi:MAG: hypothetical protein MHM6MM_000822 [Cercozoa sp. M6MM]